MKALVTGASGFIGGHLVDHLLDATDWDIIALTRDNTIQDRKRVQVTSWDLCESIPAGMFEDVDVVFNLASSSDQRSVLADPTTHVMNNILSTLNLLQWALTQRVQAFIQVSTNEVYGPAEDALYHTEWSPLVPSTPYSASKAAQEMLAIAWWRTYGLPTAIVNTIHVFGEGQPRERFIPTVIDRIMRRKPVEIYGQLSYGKDDFVSASRNWTYVGDLVHALHQIATRPLNAGSWHGGPPDRWNVAGPVRSCLNVAQSVAELLNEPLSVHWQNVDYARPGYELRYALDTLRFDSTGWRAPYGFANGLARTVNWYKRELSK